MYKVKLLGIGVVVTLLLTSFVVAETSTNEKEEMVNVASCFGQPPAVEWENTYGGDGDEALRYIQQTTDGGYSGVGMWNRESHWLLKIDADGNEEWNAISPPDNTRYPRAYVVQQTSDGGYITTGVHGDNVGYGYNRCLWKVDASGATEWLQIYSDPAFAYHHCVQETSDGGFIVAGEKDEIQPDGYNWNVMLMKTDSLGNREWQKVYSYSPDGDNIYSVRQTPDGGYILAGRVEVDYPQDADLLIIKTDANGEVEWDQTYGGAYWEACYGRDILLTSDGGYLFFGVTSSIGCSRGHATMDMWVVKTDSQGNMQWNETYGTKRNDNGVI